MTLILLENSAVHYCNNSYKNKKQTDDVIVLQAVVHACAKGTLLGESAETG